jgi:hypothetical protein
MGALGWLVNLNFSGGSAPDVHDAEATLFVGAEDTTLYATHGYDMKTIYKDEKSTAKKKAKVDWTDWLASGSAIASSTWEEESGTLSLSDQSAGTAITTAYFTGGTYDSEFWLKNTITTDDTVPLIESRSILVKIVRTV